MYKTFFASLNFACVIIGAYCSCSHRSTHQK